MPSADFDIAAIHIRRIAAADTPTTCRCCRALPATRAIYFDAVYAYAYYAVCRATRDMLCAIARDAHRATFADIAAPRDAMPTRLPCAAAARLRRYVAACCHV